MVVQTATNLTQDPSISSSSKDSHDVGFKPSEEEKRRMLIIQRIKILRLPIQYQELIKEQERKCQHTRQLNTVILTDNAADIENNFYKFEKL
ncbi:hypothetical protein Tco_1319134 [Tanacetum coccineum]